MNTNGSPGDSPLTRRRLLQISGASILSGSFLAACGSDDSTSTSSSAAVATTAKPGFDGRLIALGFCMEDDALALGVTPIGDVGDGTGHQFPQLLPAGKGIKLISVGDAPNFEQILSLNPTLTIDDVASKPLYGVKLQAASPNVKWVDRSAFNTSGGVPAVATLLTGTGAALGLAKEAAARIGVHRTRMAEAKAKLAGVGGSVAFIRIEAKDLRLEANPKAGYIGPVLYSDLGLKPPAFVQKLIDKGGKTLEYGFASVSLETVPNIDADYLFFHGDQAALDKLQSSSIWKTVPAVQKNQVYPIDKVKGVNFATTGALSNEAKANLLVEKLVG